MTRGWTLHMQAVGEDGRNVGGPEPPPTLPPIMVDSREPAIPVLNSWAETVPAWLQNDNAALDENSYVASLYEGVNFATGQERERQYRAELEKARMIEAQKRRRP